MKLQLADVLFRAIQRGYSVEEIQPCFMQNLGDGWYEVDVDHPAYPRTARDGYTPPPSIASEVRATMDRMNGIAVAVPVAGGPGTELKKLLGKIGIKSSPTCSCNKRAKTMDENGIEWCEQNVETICDWLQEEATKRKLPFIRMAGKAIVHLAIRKAKKATNK